MNGTEISTLDVEKAVTRSIIYQALGLGYAYPLGGALDRLRPVLDQAVVAGPALNSTLREPLEAWLSTVAVVSGEELATRHTALFSGGVACSAHETEYEYDPFAKSRQLADIAGFYHAFGLEIASARRTAPDFVATELEFMSLLCRKEVLSRANRWPDKMEIAVNAQRAFLRDHLGRWIETFAEELSRFTEGPPPEDGYFRTLAGLTTCFVALELAAFALSPRRLTRRMPFADADTAPACDPRAVGNLIGVASE